MKTSDSPVVITETVMNSGLRAATEYLMTPTAVPRFPTVFDQVSRQPFSRLTKYCDEAFLDFYRFENPLERRAALGKLIANASLLVDWLDRDIEDLAPPLPSTAVHEESDNLSKSEAALAALFPSSESGAPHA